ncbi:MAG: nitroreductase [Actinobacteria bacterium]|nr:nitroreductase [Actinomycetota bacterium]MDA2981776.1 nitroreductase [Actinomycetota bacterium]MDA2996784.1 nitroreductase [Actinomycetota bacterium]
MSPDSDNRDAAWVSNFLASRRSTRDFLATPVPQEIINQILTDALTAPSWSNTRPFKIAVATGDIRDRISGEFLSRWTVLSRIMRKGLKNKFRLIYSRYGLPTSNRTIVKPYVAELRPRAQKVGKELYELFGVKRGDRDARDKQWGKNYSFFGAPVEMFIYIHKSLHIYAASDAGLMMENLMLSAHGHGLGTCAQGAVNIWDDVVRKEFEIPKDYRLLCGMAIGYPSDSPMNSFKAHRIGADEVLFKAKKHK